MKVRLVPASGQLMASAIICRPSLIVTCRSSRVTGRHALCAVTQGTKLFWC